MNSLNPADILLALLIAAAVVFALRTILSGKKKGTCAGCSHAGSCGFPCGDGAECGHKEGS